MEENVYVTDYPKKLREEAQKRNIEFEESIYEFIDMFLHYHIDSYDGSLHRVRNRSGKCYEQHQTDSVYGRKT